MTAHAPLLTHMTPQVVVSHMAIITIVDPFYKGGHGSDHAIIIVCVLHIPFVLCLVMSLVHNSSVEVPGDDVQVVGQAQRCVELLPLWSATKDAVRDTFGKKELIRA